MSNPKGKWYPARILQLEIHAQTMTAEELADWFGESENCIYRALKYYGMELKKRTKRRTKRRTKQERDTRPKQLIAQESIDLFKTQYLNEPINQLLTQNWSRT